MAVADVFDIKKKKVAKVDLNDAVFGAEINYKESTTKNRSSTKIENTGNCR